jgi:hypothetical protein
MVIRKKIERIILVTCITYTYLDDCTLTVVSWNPDRDIRLFHVRSYPASLQNGGGSIQVPVYTLNNARMMDDT